jgi:hypothetical protein
MRQGCGHLSPTGVLGDTGIRVGIEIIKHCKRYASVTRGDNSATHCLYIYVVLEN